MTRVLAEDGDGWLVILLIGQRCRALYRNNHNNHGGTFADVTKRLGRRRSAGG